MFFSFRRIVNLLSAIAIFSVGSFTVSCDKKQKEPESREVFGTICTINLYESGTEKLYESIFERLKKIENQRLNLKKSDSNKNLYFTKGYATKEIKYILKEEKVKGATINLGGNIYVYGAKKDKVPWIIGIKNPSNPDGIEAASITGLEDTAIVTSGIYSQNIPREAEIKSGKELLSMTVISSDPILAEELSSKFFMMGTEDAFLFLESMKKLNDTVSSEDIRIVAINSDGKIHASRELEGYLGTILDDYSVIFR